LQQTSEILEQQNGRRFKDDGEPMFTLTAQDKHGILQVSRGKNKGALDNVSIRKLTPKECWRLQGFPDTAVEQAAQVCSDSQLYKQAGNTVTVNVVYAIATQLVKESKLCDNSCS